MITTDHLSMLYGSRVLFTDASLKLSKGRRYGLVGANGCGKSTLLRLIASSEESASGDIHISKGARLGWLKQDQHLYNDEMIVEVVLRGKPLLWKALCEKDALLSSETHDDSFIHKLEELEETIDAQDGYRAEAFAEQLLIGLGIPLVSHRKPMGSLSGGYKLRVLLAQTLFDSPDILLLDEPTNYLDIQSISWLERFLMHEYEGLLLFISHDRDFINNLATDILDIDYGEIRQYTGNYDKFIEAKEELIAQKTAERANIQKKVADMQQFIDRFKAKASKATQAQSRQKMLDKIEMPDIERSSRRSPIFQLQIGRQTGQTVLSVKELYKSFGPKDVLENVSFSIEKGDKLAILGRNGRGKSTLLKICLGLLSPDLGSATWGYETHPSYFAQDHHEMLKESIGLFDWLCANTEVTNRELIQRTLGQMLFTTDDYQKNVLTISGGEAARLLFARIILEKKNVLVLDEPTNHLDLESRDGLAAALRKYEGAMVLVSHDRHFVAQTATKILVLEEKGIDLFEGSYDDYLKTRGVDCFLRI